MADNGVVNKVIPAWWSSAHHHPPWSSGHTISWSDFKDKLFPILAAFSVGGHDRLQGLPPSTENTKEKHQARLMKALCFSQSGQ